MKKRLTILLIFIFLLLSCTRAPRLQYYSHTEFLMDTYVTIRIPNQKLIAPAFSYMRMLEQRIIGLTRTINSAPENTDFYLPISEELWQFLLQCDTMAQKTGGYFDPTVGALVKIWGFLSDTPPTQPPKANIIKTLLSEVGYTNFVLGKRNYLIKKSKFEVDFGAIAKGYIIQKTAEFLRKNGVKSGLIDAGGDIVSIGSKFISNTPAPWVIGIQDPRAPNKIIEKVRLQNAAILTSGDYERFFIYEGARYHHIISPFTGWPSHNAISATVIGSDATVADALATALMVVPRQEVESILQKFPDFSAMLIYEKADHTLEKIYLNNFQKYVISRRSKI